MILILIACLVIMITSLGGAFILWAKGEDFISKNLGILTSFASGVFIITTLHLLHEAHEGTGLLLTALSSIGGILLMLLLSRIIPEFHHHHLPGDTTHTHSKKSALRLLASDSIHNVTDGILITTSFLISPIVGIGATVSVLIHEFVQEITEFFVLRQSGMSTNEALRRNFLSSATILLGALGSFYFISFFEGIEPFLLGLSAGGFLLILFDDLIPSSVHEVKKSREVYSYSAAFILGIALMGFITTLGH